MYPKYSEKELEKVGKVGNKNWNGSSEQFCKVIYIPFCVGVCVLQYLRKTHLKRYFGRDY